MKLRLALLLIGAASLPAVASAQSASTTATGNVAIGGQVTSVCILGNPSSAVVNLGSLANTSGARVGRIATIASQSVSLPGSFCNFAGSQVSVQAGALLAADATTPPSGFARAVNYVATASAWAPANATATTAALADGSSATATGTGGVQPLPKLADIVVGLSGFTAPSDAILVAGNYSGTVVVTLGPAATAP